MFNTDRLLQETAAWVIFNKDRKVYNTIAERLPEKDKKFLDSSIENNQLLDGLNDGFFLFIEMVMFIKQSSAFRQIHGLLLSDLADKIIPTRPRHTRQSALCPGREPVPYFHCSTRCRKTDGAGSRDHHDKTR